jgi:hypothetical protein
MTFVPFSKLHSLHKLSSPLQDKVDKELLKDKFILEPILASSVSKSQKDSELSTLSDLFGNSQPQGDSFRTRFYVVKATSGEDSIVLNKGKKSKGNSEEYFSQQFLIKDTSTINDKNVYRVFIY